MISRALHLSIFEQPVWIDFFNNLLEHFTYMLPCSTRSTTTKLEYPGQQGIFRHALKVDYFFQETREKTGLTDTGTVAAAPPVRQAPTLWKLDQFLFGIDPLYFLFFGNVHQTC